MFTCLSQTPHITLWHPSSNCCHNWLCHTFMLCHRWLCYVGVPVLTCLSQTPSISLWHPSSNCWHSWLFNTFMLGWKICFMLIWTFCFCFCWLSIGSGSLGVGGVGGGGMQPGVIWIVCVVTDLLLFQYSATKKSYQVADSFGDL